MGISQALRRIYRRKSAAVILKNQISAFLFMFNPSEK
jgi:hypothetical protein